jgi:hypothetical protein
VAVADILFRGARPGPVTALHELETAISTDRPRTPTSAIVQAAADLFVLPCDARRRAAAVFFSWIFLYCLELALVGSSSAAGKLVS